MAMQEVKSLTSKEIKKLARPEFEANPDKFYPTQTLKKMGYERNRCPECKNYYWRHTPKKTTCGDSNCEKNYSFIGRGTGRGRKGKKITYAEAWKGFERSLTSARVPCTAIQRYPVVARWRADVDFVAAGIFCFQPYCVTGELQPPANPLICPQFCLRFNDLDNIGLTGRHYSGFIMLGIQVFNSKDNYKFWNSECVEFNYRWLTEELEIDPDEITFIEDVWAGGGNLGPSIEYFVNGLELGNMVFMQFKTFPDGSREPLQVQVIDVGIGLERVPWLINGSPTSYVDVFPHSLKYLLDKIHVNPASNIWEKFGPLSCLLNVDESEDLDKTWAWIGEQIGMDWKQIKSAIEPVRDAYIILDHTRSSMMAICDGMLPANSGGGANIRNLLRRVFGILERNGWWAKLGGNEGLFALYELQKKDLEPLYGPFKEYSSLRSILDMEIQRWRTTDESQKKEVTRLFTKRKGALDIKDWIHFVKSMGIAPELVRDITKLDIPSNLWYLIEEEKERTVKVQPPVLYNTAHLPATESMYFKDHTCYEFTAKIVEVLPNVLDKLSLSIVVLDRSALYPTSGGQEHDTGFMTVNGKTYRIVDVQKIGPAVLHTLDKPLPGKPEDYKGLQVTAKVDEERRVQLRNNHSATHIVFASCRRVLGPHVWQSGAKKAPERAHLDITHYQSIGFEELQRIETEANRIVQSCRDINKSWMPKDEAEKKYGFTLYQGGVVPGNELRVVNIAETDTEACCGTHCDNTAEVGFVKIQKATRISDGVVRLYFVAGENALKRVKKQASILNALQDAWGVEQTEIIGTANRFFESYKKFGAQIKTQTAQLIDLHLKCLLLDPNATAAVIKAPEDNPSAYIGAVPRFAEKLKAQGKSVAFVGEGFVYALVGKPDLLDVKKEFEPLIEKIGEREEKRFNDKLSGVDDKDKRKEKKEEKPVETPASAAKKEEGKKEAKKDSKKEQPKQPEAKKESKKEDKPAKKESKKEPKKAWEEGAEAKKEEGKKGDKKDNKKDENKDKSNKQDKPKKEEKPKAEKAEKPKKEEKEKSEPVAQPQQPAEPDFVDDDDDDKPKEKKEEKQVFKKPKVSTQTQVVAKPDEGKTKGPKSAIKPVKIDGVLAVTVTSLPPIAQDEVIEYFTSKGFALSE